MSIIVQKFGGSSLSTIDKLKAVAQRIAETRSSGINVVVVVSAMGNTTNDLLAQAHLISKHPSRRELDMLLSVGERISMTLLSMAIHEHGFHATSLTGSQCGIITTDSHSNARIIDVRPFRVQDELEKGNIVIVAGYQGSSYRREVTTLGRGGSDTTAVSLAAALGAECQIYSDVDGVFSADPRVTVDAQRLLSISYDEMLELARAGARVINEQAVAFAKAAGIAIYARSTHLKGSQGTVIRPDGFLERAQQMEIGHPKVVGIAHQPKGLFISGDRATLLDATSELPSIACRIELASDVSSWNYVDTTDIHDFDPLVNLLISQGLTVSTSIGAVSVVGDAIGGRLSWSTAMIDLLKANNITTHYLSVQYLRLTFLVDQVHTDDAVRILHREYVQNRNC